MEILPLKWAPQVPRTRERETMDPKPTMISPRKAIKPPIHLDGLSATVRSGFPNSALWLENAPVGESAAEQRTGSGTANAIHFDESANRGFATPLNLSRDGVIGVSNSSSQKSKIKLPPCLINNLQAIPDSPVTSFLELVCYCAIENQNVLMMFLVAAR
jgi:hypothetical protein